MVVSGCVERREGRPGVGVCVVHLGLLRGPVDVLARPGNEDQILAERAAGVAVACILHLGTLLHAPLILGCWQGHELGHLEHGLRQLVEVAAAHDIDLGRDHANLDGLEVVGEIRLRLDHVGGHCLSLRVVQEEPPRVLLYYVHHQVAQCLRHRGRRHRLDNGCFDASGEPKRGVLAWFRRHLLALLAVFHDVVVVALDLEALGALEYEHVEYLLDYSVHVGDLVLA